MIDIREYQSKYHTSLETAVFYTCGICNLRCRYCNIDKSEALLAADKSLEESFADPDYYFNLVKKYFPNKENLKKVETWGGEPFMRMDRIYPLLHKLINHYPYFKEMFSSTNFSYPEWTNQFFGLMYQFSQYPDRRFEYTLQMSCDGPTPINDLNRGVGTTEKCLANFDKMVDMLKTELPRNVYLIIAFKPTLDLSSIAQLQTKESIIEYYKFFEDNFLTKIMNLNMPNVHINCPIPNTAVPSPATQEDGIRFANLCKLTREIERENKDHKIFKYYGGITPFGMTFSENPNTAITYNYWGFTCGSCTSMVGFLPGNKVSACHEGFTQIVDQYKKLASESSRIGKSTIYFDEFIGEAKTDICLTEEEFIKRQIMMKFYYHKETKARLLNLTSLINMLALAGQINPEYKDQTRALEIAIFLQDRTAYCIKDNKNVTGSLTLQPLGELRLMLNGAEKYLQNYEERKDCEDCDNDI